MRFRSQTWWLLCLLFLLAGGYVWHRANQYEARRTAATAAAKIALAPHAKRLAPATTAAPFQILSPALNSTTAQSNALVTAKDDRFRFRLANTPKTIGQLTRDNRALLLENALIDTASSQPLNVPRELRAGAEPGAYIVQARGAVDKNFRDDLAAAGAEIVSYIPNNAYLVTATAGAAQKIAASSRAQFVTPYEPYFKLKTDVLKLALAGESIASTNALQTLVFPGQRDATLAALRTLGAEVLADETSGLGTILTVRPASASLTALARLGGLHSIQLVKPRKSANDLTRVRLGINANTTENVTNSYLGLTGSNVCVNVNDFGFDTAHPDLLPRLQTDPSNGTTGDTDGHGTHVTGIIISSGINSTNIGTNASGSVTGANFRGKAPNAKVLGITIQDTAHTDTYLQEKAASSTNKIFISNNSWGLVDGSSDLNDNSRYDLTAASYDAAVRDALPGVTGSQPMVYVFAAGNEGFGDDSGGGGQAGSISSPASAKNVIAVGATESPRNITNLVTLPNSSARQIFKPESDSTNEVAWYSSRGNVGIGVEGEFGRFKPDVVAPGSWIVSTRSTSWDKAAYYSPLTINDFFLGGESITTNGQNSYFLFPPANTVEVILGTAPNQNSSAPFQFPIYVSQTGLPTNGSPNGTNEVRVFFPPLLTSTFTFFTVGNPYLQNNNYDLYGSIVTSNYLGDYWQVRSNLDVGLAPYYRYESGTSMAAPAVAGQLALMQEFFERFAGGRPSPALMKALLINGARSLSSQYDLQVKSLFNYQGWGLANLPNSLPSSLSNYLTSATGAMLAADQNPTNALATGQSATRYVKLTTAARNQPLRISLVWTDPPGDPTASLKLVNDLDLVVTNLDTGDVYFGNDIQSGSRFNSVWDTNGLNVLPNTDVINNVENIFLSPADELLGTNYSITVVGSRVNVNAVTAHTNDYVQDYALVISCGNGALSNALTLTTNAPATNVTVTLPLITTLTGVLSNGIPLLNQHVGGNTPLLGTTNGMTNQWHFYIITNDTPYTNIAFLTFSPTELSVPRLGTRESYDTNAVRLEADIDLYVSTDPNLTNLNALAIANADVSQSRPGSEVVAYTNSVQNTIYYIGVKSEDSMAADYGFFGVASELPFDETDANGNHIVRGKPVRIAIPDGSPNSPGAALIFGVATKSYKARRVVVTNNVSHQLMGDLFGDLQHSGRHVVLNNHTPGNGNINQTFIYTDPDEGDIANAQRPDGPGSFLRFVGQQASGVWQFTMLDNAATHIGTNGALTLLIEPENETNGYAGTIGAFQTRYFPFTVPPEATNVAIFVAGTTQPVDLYVKRDPIFAPSANYNDYNTSFNPPGGFLIIDRYSTPPLTPGNYYAAVHNASSSSSTYHFYTTNGLDIAAVNTLEFGSSGPMPLLDDAVTNAVISVTNSAATNRIYSTEVGVRIDHSRESDLALTLVSPQGTRVLLAEERGKNDANGYGSTAITTNVFPLTTAGGFQASTNTLNAGQNFGTLNVTYNFFNIPDRMVVYYDGAVIFDTGMTNNPGSVLRSFSLDFGPGASSSVVIVMNPGNNTNTITAWEYTPTIVTGHENYFTFTENTNKAVLPMKFFPPPFRGSTASNFFTSSFEGLTPGIYAAPTTGLDGWSVTANSVTVLTNPVAVAGTNSIGLAEGTLARTETLIPGHKYSFNFSYRDATSTNPIAWWPGQSNTTDIISSNSAAAVGGLAYTNAIVSSGFSFNGLTSYMLVPSTAALKFTNHFTVEGWVKYSRTSFGGSNSVHIISKGQDAVNGPVDWSLGISSPTQKLRPHAKLGGNWIYFDCATTLQFDTWYHVAMVYTGTKLQGYVNGVLDGSQNVTGALQATDFALKIGAYQTTLPDAHFPGPIDDIAIFDRNLSATELTQIYQAGASGKCGMAVPPAICGGASAVIGITGQTNETLTATNTTWKIHTTTFTATQPSYTLQFQGVQSGMMLDNISLVDLGIEGYAFPEESLDKLKGEVAYGNWKLEVWDKRVGATNPTPTLQAWKMSFVLDNTVPLINTNNTTAAFNPTLPAQTNRAVDELVPLTITNTATPAFLTNTLTYTLVNPPAGAAISTNGVITWTPSEIQGYGTWNFTTIVTDDQSPAGRATNSFTVTVNEVNVAPVLPEILVVTNYFVTPGTFTFFDPAVDSDYPANDLTYTLLNAPTNAIIDANGLITWTPGTNDAPSTNLFRIVVTDFSPFALTNQHLSATNFFYLVVGVGSNAPTFSLMQYNVKGNGAPDWTTNATQVAAIGREIRYLQPDVITFNEIPVAFAYEMTNWAKDFLSGYNVSVSAGHDVAIGNAIATKFAVSTRSSLHGTSLVPYGYNGTFTRDLFEAIVTVPGFAHPVHFFSAHLKSSASGYADAALKRAAEAAAITNFFTTNLFAVFPNDYYVLSGDMNEADTNTLAIQTLLTNTGLKMTAPVNPYSGSLNTFSIQSPPPSSRIDYIFPCGALASNILSSQVFRTDLVAPTPTNFNAGDDALASDHLPVLMTFRDPTFVASNLAPVFVTTPQSTNVAPLTTFTATNLATDSDLPPQTITYSLVNPPTGMTIDSATAVILWTPAANQLGTFTIGTVATDNGSPARSATNYFQLFVVDFANIATNIVAFPGAEGAGAFAVGGRGGSVYHVTSLINDGPGSLRFGLRTPNRTIVFDISGTIELTSDLKINRSYLTIAGQTAPGEGITLSRRLTSVQDNHDVQIRFIRCRPGDYYGTNFQNDSFHFDKVTNSIADHVSASWSIDETLSCTESRDITVQWSMITDSLNNSFHDKGPHGYGSLIRYGDGKITYHHNLYADHNSRNPRLGDNLTLDFVNNVIYNWGNLPGYSGDDATDILDNPLGFTNRLNYVGNYAVAGSNSSQRVSAFVGYTTNTWVYSASNRIDSALDGALNGTNSDFGLISGLFTPSAVPFALLPPAVTTEAAATAYERVMSFAGASRVRDTVDQNILNKVINQTGVIIDSQTQVGGWPLLNSLTPAPDTDQDGMPNYWETTLGLTDPNNGSDGPLNSGNGYTYLENYLNWLAAPHALVLHDTFVDVDLKLLAGNTVAQGFGVSGASNGVVVLQGDGHTARFTPTTNFTGFAAFNLNVTNLVTGGGFGPVPVSVLVSAISFPTNTTTVTNPPVIISSTSFNSTNGFTLNWTAPVTSQFQVQWTTNLIPVISWTSFTNILTSGSGNFTFTDDGSQSGGFTAPHYYRLLTLP